MKLSILFLSFFFSRSSCSTKYTSVQNPERLENILKKSDAPIFSRSSTLTVPHDLNSHVPAMLSVFYSVPQIQSAFYEEANLILEQFDTSDWMRVMKSSIIVSTALVFAHMRVFPESLDLSFYFEALKNELGRDMEDVLIMFRVQQNIPRCKIQKDWKTF